MKYIKTFEFYDETKLLKAIKNYNIDNIKKASEKGISPKKYLQLNDDDYNKFLNYLNYIKKTKDAFTIAEYQKVFTDSIDKDDIPEELKTIHNINKLKQHHDNFSRVDNLFDRYENNHAELYDYISYKAKLGVKPQEALNLNDKEYIIFLDRLPVDKKYRIENITNNISDYIDKDLIKNQEQKDKYKLKNKEFVLNTIIDGLKNGVPMIDTIDAEFKNINVDDVLDMLTDNDKKIINKYQKQMSNTPENI